jgi:hypothetical protein
MIHNATLLRVDPPAPGPLGASIDVRCALTPPTVEQARISAENEWGATAILYIPLAHVPSPRPVGDGNVLVRVGHNGDETLYAVKQVQQRIASVIGHILLYLAPAE